jgi:signal transduction histidine kinase
MTRSPTSGALDTELGETRFVAIPVSIGETSGVLVAASLTAAERDQVESAVRIAIGVSIVVLLLASLFIWLAAGRAIAPLNALSRTARQISETDFSSRIPVRGHDEIAVLGRTFNGMLDRLEVAFAAQKDFLSDVSHELRTPITVIRGHLETLGDSPAEREEAMAVIQDELDRMSRYVDDLLLLVKAPRPDFLRTGPIDLDLFTHDLFAKARSLGDRDWRLDGTGIGIVVADQQRLTQAMMNLAENAVAQTGPGDAIWLGSSHVGSTARLWVRDEGPGVDPADRERIFDRGERGNGEGDGTGLGLSIVEAIAEAHGGWVELDSRPGLGSTFTIVIPAEPATPEP